MRVYILHRERSPIANAIMGFPQVTGPFFGLDENEKLERIEIRKGHKVKSPQTNPWFRGYP